VTVIRAFRSEWLKMLRPSIILGAAGTMCGFAVLAVVLRLSRLGGTHIGPGTDVTAAMVAASNGFAPLIVYTAPLLGVVSLAVCAVAVGTEYSNGTLRNLLVRQPARLRLLTGKLLALGSFVTLAVVVSYGVGLVAALLLVPGHGVSTSAWFTAGGVQSLLSTAGNLVLATLAWAAFGEVLAIVLRSAAAAISLGLGYLLVGETLLTSVWAGGNQWLPRVLLVALGLGGTPEVAYGRALVLTGLYVVVAIGVAAILFRQRDVTV
jgi:ABC-type transport system involved in multi-copper enzyme maturation permease subunit